jgi:hypothetical protein
MLPLANPGDVTTVLLPKPGFRPDVELQDEAAGSVKLSEQHWIQVKGGTAGERFELRRAGPKVKQLTLWGDPGNLRGVQVEFVDGAQQAAGTLAGEWSISIRLLSLMSRTPAA